jgi:hypothetical protein
VHICFFLLCHSYNTRQSYTSYRKAQMTKLCKIKQDSQMVLYHMANDSKHQNPCSVCICICFPLFGKTRFTTLSNFATCMNMKYKQLTHHLFIQGDICQHEPIFFRPYVHELLYSLTQKPKKIIFWLLYATHNYPVSVSIKEATDFRVFTAYKSNNKENYLTARH